MKESNAKKDQEIASLKIRQEEMTTAIQNNMDNVDYLTYYSTLMNLPQTCQELQSRGVDRSGSFPINPDGSGNLFTIYPIVVSSNTHYKLENRHCLFVKRSQYVGIENPLHKQSEKAYMCF